MKIAQFVFIVTLFLVSQPLFAQSDPYERYVKTSNDFRAVNQNEKFLTNAWPSWTYIPWYYKWDIGFNAAGGKFQQQQGYNGAFIDGSNLRPNGTYTGGKKEHLGWINKYKLRFYMDHTAGKGYLHLWDGSLSKQQKAKTSATGMRPQPLNDQLKLKLKKLVTRNVKSAIHSPFRTAYALDDEPSWGHFVAPTMWQITDDQSVFKKWLREIYGEGNVPKRNGWIGYNQIRTELPNWTIAKFDASQLMDQWSFNDSYYNNFIGDLVEHGNSIDPKTPVGLVGGQSPNAFGGYDYAKLMRKVQFLESYNLGSSQSIMRSFNPNNAIPTVTTHFHKSVKDSTWQIWYYLAHGNRGHIAWVDKGWFDGKTPARWHQNFGKHTREAAQKIGPLMANTKWKHDGVAIYYSHPSIQLGWIFDAEAHGKTWPNRNNDHKLGASHLVRHAWENMLRDEGIQFDHLSYVDVIQKGIPKEYKVLILPACLALSDAEAKQVEKFCKAGGTVIADYLPGLWDQHGKGRQQGGILDEMFGVKHNSNLKAADIFGNRLWCEVDQDANFYYKSYVQFLTNKNSCIKHNSGFHKAVRKMKTNHKNKFGNGTAILMNLSPQWYNAYRSENFATAKQRRQIFIQPIHNAGINRWVKIGWGKIDSANEKQHGYEITYWTKGNRTVLFVCQNPEVEGTSAGGGHAGALKSERTQITLRFKEDIKDVRNERTGKTLPSGREFTLQWKMNEAIVVSFKP